jgi:hypothetical protein
LISEKTRNFLEAELYEAINGWYFKRLIPRHLSVRYPTYGVGNPYRWPMKDLIEGFLIALIICILFFGAIHLTQWESNYLNMSFSYASISVLCVGKTPCNLTMTVR